jgi:hypothetical protein
MQLITPDSFEALVLALNDLLTDQTACITADGYKRLTGDDLSVPVTEGRIMIGNLAARTNCTVAITDLGHPATHLRRKASFDQLKRLAIKNDAVSGGRHTENASPQSLQKIRGLAEAGSATNRGGKESEQR